MMAPFRWIGALPSALQAGLDRAVSLELHSTAVDICRHKPRRSADQAVCTFVNLAPGGEYPAGERAQDNFENGSIAA